MNFLSFMINKVIWKEMIIMFKVAEDLMKKIEDSIKNSKTSLIPKVAGGPITFACIGCQGSCSNTCTGACRTGCSSTCQSSSGSRW